MSDGLKLAGLIVSGLLCFGFAVIGVCWDYPELMPFAYSFGGLVPLILGLPRFLNGVKTLGRKLFNE